MKPFVVALLAKKKPIRGVDPTLKRPRKKKQWPIPPGIISADITKAFRWQQRDKVLGHYFQSAMRRSVRSMCRTCQAGGVGGVHRNFCEYPGECPCVCQDSDFLPQKAGQ